MRCERPAERGFTFLEIVVVVLLIALVSAVMVTRIGGRTAAPLKASGRFLCAELEYAAQRAIATGQPQRWLVDLDSQLFRVEQLPLPEPAGLDTTGVVDLAAPLPADAWEPIPEAQGEWRELYESSIGIHSVVVSGEALEAGQVAIHFAPDGGADPADVWLLDEENRTLRVAVTAFTGEVQIAEDEPGA
jgi:prepilin-type N-terminal cleavage/methylation domain-containing protein